MIYPSHSPTTLHMERQTRLVLDDRPLRGVRLSPQHRKRQKSEGQKDAHVCLSDPIYCCLANHSELRLCVNFIRKQTNKNSSESISEPSANTTCNSQNPGVCFLGFGRPDAPWN